MEDRHTVQAAPPSRGFPAQSASGGTRVLNNPVPKLEEPVQFSDDTAMRDTPDVAGDMDSRLKIETSEDESEDSLLSDTSSEADDAVPKSKRGLPIAELPTGLCYDERMRYHAEVAATSGENVHPEDPRRIYYIYKELCEAGLVDDKKYPPMVEVPLYRIDAREATRDECLLIHTREHYDFVKSTAGRTTRCIQIRRDQS